jgi:hypothetical protein
MSTTPTIQIYRTYQWKQLHKAASSFGHALRGFDCLPADPSKTLEQEAFGNWSSGEFSSAKESRRDSLSVRHSIVPLLPRIRQRLLRLLIADEPPQPNAYY